MGLTIALAIMQAHTGSIHGGGGACVGLRLGGDD
ncbi:hypothetical protein FHX59_002450 [Paraburkholderia silvatlantica]|uniref:Uncharacterized protein n=1 Tax=Paraburkholderia silvatlantica TaxID=321895 RepID=A0ABR6FKR9_9BURK|nr:hypothetical protein [Paraburkholderia silvatlantica]